MNVRLGEISEWIMRWCTWRCRRRRFDGRWAGRIGAVVACHAVGDRPHRHRHFQLGENRVRPRAFPYNKSISFGWHSNIVHQFVKSNWRCWQRCRSHHQKTWISSVSQVSIHALSGAWINWIRSRFNSDVYIYLISSQSNRRRTNYRTVIDQT